MFWVVNCLPSAQLVIIFKVHVWFVSQDSPELLGLAYVPHSFYCISCMCMMTSNSLYRIHGLTKLHIWNVDVLSNGWILNSIMPQIMILSFHVAKTYQFWILLLHTVRLHCFQRNIHKVKLHRSDCCSTFWKWLVPISLTKKYNIFHMPVNGFCTKFPVSWGFKPPIAT